MLRTFLGGDHSVLPLLVTVASFAFFGLVLLYALTDGRRAHQRHMESLPLEGDDHG